MLRLDVGDAATLDDLRRAARPGCVVIHSIPSVDDRDPTPLLLDALGDRPRRVIYLSTTGVYGSAREVDETTEPAPATARTQLRLDAERAVAAGPWQSLILRPAAIYGPGRGVHVAMREGRFPLVDGGHNFTSRIHVDDLAAHVEAAVFSDATGAWPVADDEPSTSFEIASYCADLLRVPMPESVAPGAVSETRRADRRVDGRAIRRILGVTLRYPSYRVGIPASLDEEQANVDHVGAGRTGLE